MCYPALHVVGHTAKVVVHDVCVEGKVTLEGDGSEYVLERCSVDCKEGCGVVAGGDCSSSRVTLLRTRLRGATFHPAVMFEAPSSRLSVKSCHITGSKYGVFADPLGASEVVVVDSRMGECMWGAYVGPLASGSAAGNGVWACAVPFQARSAAFVVADNNAIVEVEGLHSEPQRRLRAIDGKVKLVVDAAGAEGTFPSLEAAWLALREAKLLLHGDRARGGAVLRTARSRPFSVEGDGASVVLRNLSLVGQLSLEGEGSRWVLDRCALDGAGASSVLVDGERCAGSSLMVVNSSISNSGRSAGISFDAPLASAHLEACVFASCCFSDCGSDAVIKGETLKRLGSGGVASRLTGPSLAYTPAPPSPQSAEKTRPPVTPPSRTADPPKAAEGRVKYTTPQLVEDTQAAYASVQPPEAAKTAYKFAGAPEGNKTPAVGPAPPPHPAAVDTANCKPASADRVETRTPSGTIDTTTKVEGNKTTYTFTYTPDCARKGAAPAPPPRPLSNDSPKSYSRSGGSRITKPPYSSSSPLSADGVKETYSTVQSPDGSTHSTFTFSYTPECARRMTKSRASDHESPTRVATLKQLSDSANVNSPRNEQAEQQRAALMAIHPLDMSVSHVADWMSAHGYEAYAKTFSNAGVDGDALLMLSDLDLQRTFGIASVQTRSEILQAVRPAPP
eukprot:tig00020849_g14624.t1